MRYNCLWYLLSVMALLTSLSCNAQTLHLSDVLAATLEHQAGTHTLTEPDQSKSTQAFSWLDGAPSLTAAYLHSQHTNGSNEAELSLNLPIKSKLRKQVEQKLSASSEILQASTQRQQALYYSGVIRELIWQHQWQHSHLSSISRKATLLSDLLAKYERLSELNAVPQYALFLLKKELNDTLILQHQAQHNLASTLARYQDFTGLQAIPDNVSETLPQDPQTLLSTHPDVVTLDATWSAFAQSVQGQSKAAQAWDLSLTAKRVDSQDFAENQIGLGLTFALDIGNALSPSLQNEYRQAHLKYALERNKLLLELALDNKTALSEHAFLRQKQSMLVNGQDNLNALEQSLGVLLNANTQNQALHIRHFIELIDAQSEVSLNHIAMQHQVALINQSLGLTL